MSNNKILAGTRVVDDRGRKGVVTQICDDGFFARPESVPYVTDHDIPGVGIAKTITATHFGPVRAPVLGKGRYVSGDYVGIWFDAPLNDFVSLTVVE